MHDRYMKRLARCTTAELHAMKAYVAAHRGQMRYGELMLRCIVAALLAKAGLETA